MSDTVHTEEKVVEEVSKTPEKKVRKKRDPAAPKKPRSEKQIAAFIRCQEMRRKKLLEKKSA